MTHETQNGSRTWTEQFEIAASDLVERARELIHEGNVRRMIIKSPSDRVLLEVPLNAGVAVGAAAAIINPVLATIGAAVALFARVKVEIVRVDGGNGGGDQNTDA